MYWKSTVAEIKERAAQSKFPIVNQEREQEIKDYIDQIKRDGDTIGGVVETVVGAFQLVLVPYVQWDRKLDARLAQAVVSINAFKGGIGLDLKLVTAKEAVMDEILWSKEDGYTRRTNNLGGFEGGMTNGQPSLSVVLWNLFSLFYKPLMSVDIETHEPLQGNRGEKWSDRPPSCRCGHGSCF